jgi:3'-phosphoadenosine 5'-phosphosulfate sulfotransferase (PAPS reductase)/FAD synthetase
MIPEKLPWLPLPAVPNSHHKTWRWIVVNSSGGKDSQTALRAVLKACDAQEFDRSRVIVSHQDLGDMEWPGTFELARYQAEAHGLEFLTSKRRDQHGQEPSLLEAVRARGKWPDNKNRYCTSDYKRGPGTKILTQLSRRPGGTGPILNVFGFRAEESPARAKKPELALNPRASSQERPVWDWLPIHHWTEDQVWHDIRQSGIKHHPAYDLGMSRLSCVFCIFAPKAALMIAGQANPALLDRYCQVEAEIGHDFQHNKPLSEVRAAIARGETPGVLTGAWNM